MPPQTGPLIAPGTGNARAVTAQPHRGCGREPPAGSVGQSHPGAIDLALPGLAAELAGSLDQREDAVHPGVAVGQPAAVGVERELAAGRRSLATDEVARLAPAAEAECFQGQKDSDREAVVNLAHVDVSGPESRHPECCGAAVDRRRRRKVWNAADSEVGVTLAVTEDPHWRLGQVTRSLSCHDHDGASAVGNQAAVEQM